MVAPLLEGFTKILGKSYLGIAHVIVFIWKCMKAWNSWTITSMFIVKVFTCNKIINTTNYAKLLSYF